MHEKERPVRTSRRGVLSAFAGTGIAAVLASVGANPATAEVTETTALTGVTATGSTGVLSLGTFESGLDDWETDDAADLSRVGLSDRPVAVTEGEHALEVSVGGDSSPSISRPVGSLDLTGHPHFVADVAPGRVEGTDAPVAFQFRLYRPSDLLDGALELLAESDPVTVRQAVPGRIFWDASDVDADLLDAVSRLELRWYPTDHPPDSSDFDYRGSVVFDAVRATDSVDPVGSARLAATMTELEFDHGPYERTEVTAESDDVEEGELVFADGATEPYRFEILAEDRFRLTLDDTEVKLGGGWS